MKRILVIALCLILYLVSCSGGVRDKYEEEFLKNKDSYAEISEILIRHHKENDLTGEVSVWCSEDGGKVFYDNEKRIDNPVDQKELNVICEFLSGSRYEYVSINKDFVEFGNSTGSVFVYLSLTNKRPEKVSDHHTMYNFSGGWYCSVSMAR
ncbi:MAG: hypothetical protein E7627_04275 [Ruminococcaceae bacterium]|nr:hypothetical protein [Oscillospiraceae bacterium]